MNYNIQKSKVHTQCTTHTHHTHHIQHTTVTWVRVKWFVHRGDSQPVTRCPIYVRVRNGVRVIRSSCHCAHIRYCYIHFIPMSLLRHFARIRYRFIHFIASVYRAMDPGVVQQSGRRCFRQQVSSGQFICCMCVKRDVRQGLLWRT
jgi:hypothetical protein